MTRALQEHGYLYFVTDIEEYAQFARKELNACSFLKKSFWE